jgi:hypothetical protein
LTFNCNDDSVIKKFLEDSGMILHISKLNSKPNVNYQINIFDQTIINQLSFFNINENKQDSYILPDWLLKNNYLHHFLRGYLDARYSLFFSDKKLILIINNCFNFLTQINEVFIKNINCNFTAKIKNINLNSYQLRYLTNQAKAITEYLYKDATIFLQRKYDIAKLSKELKAYNYDYLIILVCQVNHIKKYP